MIPADRIEIDGDTAWLVTDFASSVSTYMPRPCDTCGGSGAEAMDSMLAVGVPGGQYPIGPCPDCDGTGRHVFEIEVLGPYGGISDDGPGPHTLDRLSIFVVEVLPIVRYSLQADGGAHLMKRLNPAMDGKQWCLIRPDMNSGEAERLSLPLAAQPGMWAVRLQVVTS